MTWLPTHRICQHESHAILDYIIFASKALHNSQIAIKSAYFTALLFSLIESVQTFAQSRAWSVFNSKLCDRVWHALSKKRGLGILLQLMTSCLTVSDFRGKGGMPSWPRTDLDLWGGRTLAGKHNTDFPLRHLRSPHPPRTAACSAKANKITHTCCATLHVSSVSLKCSKPALWWLLSMHLAS